MAYIIDYEGAERQGCSCKLTIDDRTYFIINFTDSNKPSKYFTGDQKGNVEKEISRAEFELWLNILADKNEDLKDILGKVCLGKKY